ncbi:MAG: LamG domain-containing protein [Kiritimatiellaeota bacterium]|nr:LamG domain-containing protein [Kiritimatiellota bacterium]
MRTSALHRGIFALLVLCLATGAVSRSTAASWSFEKPGDLAMEAPGAASNGRVVECRSGPGRVGNGLILDGRGGVVLPPSDRLGAEHGLTLECWIRPRTGPGLSMNLITRPDQYMLRVDPARVGGNISFYVRSENGQWEPRARGPRLIAGQWQHVLAIWDRRRAYLWVNRIGCSVPRQTRCPAGSASVYMGGPVPEMGLAGFDGSLDEVRILNRALSHPAAMRRVYGLTLPGDTPKRSGPDFRFDGETEGWTGDGPVFVRQGALCAELRPGISMLKSPALALDAAAHPVCSVRLAVDRGRRGVFTFASDKRWKDIPFRLIPDGRMRWYTLRCSQQPPWDGTIGVIGFRIEGTGPANVRIDAIHLGRTSRAPPDLRISAVAPARRINALDRSVDVVAWVRNFGGTARNISVHLHAPPGVAIDGLSVATLQELGFDRTRELHWQVRATHPIKGLVRVEVTHAGQVCATMERPIRFARDPDSAGRRLAESRPWRRAGYPRAMDFRHLWPQSISFLEHSTVLLVDLIGEKIPAAIEFKRRYPDRLVLMQVNDELNGIWGSWHCVPREFAVKEGLRFDPVVFPMPKFRGYWLLGPGAALDRDFPAATRSITIRVPTVKWFVDKRGGRTYLRDVLLYRRIGEKKDWTTSEFASVTQVDEDRGAITLERWPRNAVGPWRSFRARQAWVAPSAGSIYQLGADRPLIKTWVPNLTKFCPRDPETGLNARSWWARHFARLWRQRIARTSPHPDGLQFDGLKQGRIGDADNDGRLDNCVFQGVDYWAIGLTDFFRELREGGEGWDGIGDGLICADASSVWGPPDPSVLNGSENEEFPSFSGPSMLPEGLDLYRVWSNAVREPSCSYIQGRFSCDTYLEGDWTREKTLGRFHPDALVRFSIAAACMEDGIYTYRTGSRRDIQDTLQFRELLDYPWDELHAGRRGRWNWLGLPAGPPIRLTDHLGADLLPRTSEPAGWTVLRRSTATAETEQEESPRIVRKGGRKWIEVRVEAPPSTDSDPPWARSQARRVALLSPATSESLAAGLEYSLECDLWAEPVYRTVAGDRFANALRPVSVALCVDGDGRAAGVAQSVLVGRTSRHVALTLRAPAPATGPVRVIFWVGAVPGMVRVANVRLRKGCAEILARRFDHGVALANGSALDSYTFDLKRIAANRACRRLSGAQAPDVNSGEPVGEHVTVPPQDGLLLEFR